ncbi:hypothetical protein EON65_39255, partial [archaeon]
MSVPIFRRDMTLPYWWSTDLDYTLLGMVCEYGCTQWKKCAGDARLKGPEKESMVLPPKVNGTFFKNAFIFSPSHTITIYHSSFAIHCKLYR